MASMSFSYRIGRSTVSNIIREVSEALWQALHPIYLPQPDENTWKCAAEAFKEKWQFPNCIGAIDGKHVVVQAPNSSGSVYYNYKGSFSIILMAVADANCRFLYVDVGAAGSQSDGGVFHNCSLGQKLQKKELSFPEPAPLDDETTQWLPFVFVANEAFPLRLNIIRPFPERQLDTEKRVYNYRLARARRCVENVFGIMASRFRILRRPIIAAPATVEKIVKAAVCLHNYLKQEDDVLPAAMRKYCPPGFGDCEDRNGNFVTGDWRNDTPLWLRPVRRLSSNSYGVAPASVRNAFCLYFNNEGAVPWQRNIIHAIS